jgi:hypothetical protein
VTSFTDNSASYCINPFAGPNAAGVYYAATTYWYKVQSIFGSSASALSASHRHYVYYHGSQGGTTNPSLNTGQSNGGLKWWGEFQDVSPSERLVSGYNANIGPSESGADISLQNVPSAYWLPVAGYVGTNWDIWGGAWNNLSIDAFLAAGSNARFQIHGEVAGDRLITAGNFDITPYAAGGSVLYNQWQTYTIPMSVFMTGDGTGVTANGVYQQMIYKFLLQIWQGSAAGCAFDNIFYGP